jgi:hypothetical protein
LTKFKKLGFIYYQNIYFIFRLFLNFPEVKKLRYFENVRLFLFNFYKEGNNGLLSSKTYRIISHQHYKNLEWIVKLTYPFLNCNHNIKMLLKNLNISSTNDEIKVKEINEIISFGNMGIRNLILTLPFFYNLKKLFLRARLVQNLRAGLLTNHLVDWSSFIYRSVLILLVLPLSFIFFTSHEDKFVDAI